MDQKMRGWNFEVLRFFFFNEDMIKAICKVERLVVVGENKIVWIG